MGTSTEELSNDIARTRADLEQDLDALQDKVSPSAIMERRKTAVRGRLASAKDRVMGTGHSVWVGPGRRSRGGQRDLERRQRPRGPGRGQSPGRRPGGLRCGPAHRRPDARHQGGGPRRQRLKDVAQEHGQPVIDQAKSAAQEVGEQLKDKATQAADEVKSSAQESAERVKDEAPRGRPPTGRPGLPVSRVGGLEGTARSERIQGRRPLAQGVGGGPPSAPPGPRACGAPCHEGVQICA